MFWLFLICLNVFFIKLTLRIVFNFSFNCYNIKFIYFFKDMSSEAVRGNPLTMRSSTAKRMAAVVYVQNINFLYYRLLNVFHCKEI